MVNSGLFNNQFVMDMSSKPCFSYHKFRDDQQIESYHFKIVGVVDLMGEKHKLNLNDCLGMRSINTGGKLEFNDCPGKGISIDNTVFDLVKIRL